jgi:GDP-L-fucose synthase
MIDKQRILVTGGSGMLGSALREIFKDAVYVTSSDSDLTCPMQTDRLFKQHKPDMLVHLAARVGGVKSNYDFVADFYTDNIKINTNVLDAAHKYSVKKVISLLSTCVYPDDSVYPLTEDQVHNGHPHFSNFGYAFAKRMLDVQSRAYRRQYGSNYLTAIPNNLYGEYDNFNLAGSHVVPALIRKVWQAKVNNHPYVECWGDGSPLREFTYSRDVARIILFLLENYNHESPINIGNTNQISISELVQKICKIMGYSGQIIWNIDEHSGQSRKPSSNQKLLSLGWKREWYTPLDVGLSSTCEWFIKNYPNVRGI